MSSGEIPKSVLDAQTSRPSPRSFCGNASRATKVAGEACANASTMTPWSASAGQGQRWRLRQRFHRDGTTWCAGPASADAGACSAQRGSCRCDTRRGHRHSNYRAWRRDALVRRNSFASSIVVSQCSSHERSAHALGTS